MAYRYHIGEGNIRRGYVKYSAKGVSMSDSYLSCLPVDSNEYPLAIVYLPEDDFVKALEIADKIFQKKSKNPL